MSDAIDLSDFETRLVLRKMRIEDYDQLVTMQRACFPAMKPWGRDQIESQLETFPAGQMVIEIDGQLAASSSSLRLNYDENMEWHDWKKTADAGYIRNHKPAGDVLYGIEIMVHPDFRGKRLSRRLYDARKEYCVEQNIKRMIIGGRIPGYHKYADKMTAREYVERVMHKAIFDTVLTAQTSNGFSLQGLLPNYLPSDTESCGYATYLEWRNLDYTPKSKRTLRRLVDTVRLGVVQYQMRAIKDFDDFAQQVRYFVDVAGDYKCDFVMLPELFSVQLLSTLPNMRPGEGARKLAEFTPQLLELFTELAVSFDVNLIPGSHLSLEDGRLFNVAFLCHRDGRIDRQYKLHITPSERRWWGVEGGDGLNVMDTDCGKVSIQICYDCEFPELGRLAAEQGANIIFVPYNTDNRMGYMRVRTCAAARCIENEVFVAISGCTGNLPFVANADIHYAQSAILTPCDVSFSRDGVANETNPNIETVLIQDVDLELLRRQRLGGTVRTWQDRRTDLYKVVEVGES